MIKKVFFLLFFCTLAIQSQEHVLWTTHLEKVTYDTYLLKFKAKIQSKWHLYSQNLPEKGPLPTEFKYIDSDHYQLTGQLTESKPIKTFDDNFGVDVSYFENSAEFSQKIKVTSSDQFSVSGKIYYMVCNEEMCIPFEDDFSIKITP